MPKIEVLIGMIASGKSTYARKRAEDDGALIVCHDDLSAMLHGKYGFEQGLRECYRRMEESLVRCGLNAGRDVIIDRTHLTRESRQRWVDWINAKDVQIVAVTFPILDPETHTRRRFESDPRGRPYREWHMVAWHHFGQARSEPLDWEAEGFTACKEGSTSNV